ncbi:hypothetical protein [Streptomyces nondiastaticus]|uniref:Uncharacterized protein n=1 Tax=Streptomyces nondiastaticus TaxID=3154512 RepID=A0ABW6U2T3_9ACTN
MERWDRAGRCAAYGAALALTPYLLIKMSWVIGSLLGLLPVGAGFTPSGWVLLNTVTIGMAATGIALALALARPWGMRLPGRPVAFVAWVGSGFLVAVLPYSVLSTLLDPGSGPGGGGDDDPSMPGWEAALVQAGFVGMGLGLAVALPAYLRRRWPERFAGRLGDGCPGNGCPGHGSRASVPWTAVLAAAVGLAWLYWAAGGTLAVDHPAERTTGGSLLTGLGALWALAGSAAALALARARPARLPLSLPLALGWLGSGSLFAWSGWKLPVTLFAALAHPAGLALPENPAAAALLHVAAVAAGAGMLRMLVSTPRHQPS